MPGCQKFSQNFRRKVLPKVLENIRCWFRNVKRFQILIWLFGGQFSSSLLWAYFNIARLSTLKGSFKLPTNIRCLFSCLHETPKAMMQKKDLSQQPTNSICRVDLNQHTVFQHSALLRGLLTRDNLSTRKKKPPLFAYLPILFLSFFPVSFLSLLLRTSRVFFLERESKQNQRNSGYHLPIIFLPKYVKAVRESLKKELGHHTIFGQI